MSSAFHSSMGALKKMPPMEPKDRLLIIGVGGAGVACLSVAPHVTQATTVVADIDPAR